MQTFPAFMRLPEGSGTIFRRGSGAAEDGLHLISEIPYIANQGQYTDVESLGFNGAYLNSRSRTFRVVRESKDMGQALELMIVFSVVWGGIVKGDGGHVQDHNLLQIRLDSHDCCQSTSFLRLAHLNGKYTDLKQVLRRFCSKFDGNPEVSAVVTIPCPQRRISSSPVAQKSGWSRSSELAGMSAKVPFIKPRDSNGDW
ncbi:hypothetical protein PM082_024019 [Marasmius tenuissimus]|nr:hypothetical protein PM082_024019 [Marasmius tenuissimus]